jgi:hypothetical protein
MSEQSTETTSAPADGGQDLDERVGAVERAVERVEQAIARLVPSSREDSRERVESRLDRPSTIEEQVRAELGRAQSEQAGREQAQADKDERESISQRVSKLEERPPAPPVRRSTKLLGWGDGR